MSIIKLLHGSDRVIESPGCSLGKVHNHYGQGFYCREWACNENKDGFVNE